MLKKILLIIGALLILGFVGLFLFIHKAKNGWARYETESHKIVIPNDKPAILVMSKTTAFRHAAAIKASLPFFENLAKANNWFIYQTEDAGIINSAQLKEFEVIIWNNSTGPILTDEQRDLVESFVENGGSMIGIHGSGDDSHKWDWYIENLIGSQFSHHPIKEHIQGAMVTLNDGIDSTWVLANEWNHEDEWYVFYDQPNQNGMTVIYEIDGESINPDGNLLWIRNKSFGMGKRHPVAWYRHVNKGKTFYTSLGHTAETYSNPNFIKLIEESVRWSLL